MILNLLMITYFPAGFFIGIQLVYFIYIMLYPLIYGHTGKTLIPLMTHLLREITLNTEV